MSTEASVIIPTRDRQELLRRSLTSALTQEGVDLEVIVVDDASSDDTDAYLRSVSDSRLRVIRHSVRSGVSAARNRGIEVASGRWLAFLDDDDRWLPGRLRRTIDAALAVRADFAYGGVVMVDLSGQRIQAPPTVPPDELAVALRHGNVISAPSSVVASVDLLNRVGGFDTGLSYMADWDMWIRMAAVAGGACITEPLVEYTVHSGNMLLTSGIDVLGEFERLRARHPEVEPARHTALVAKSLRGQGHRFKASWIYLKDGVRPPNGGLLLRAIAVPFGERVMSAGSRVRRRLSKLTAAGSLEPEKWQRHRAHPKSR